MSPAFVMTVLMMGPRVVRRYSSPCFRRLYVMTILGTTVSAFRKSERDLMMEISCLMACLNSCKIRNSSRGEKASPYNVRIVVSRKLSI